MKIDIIPHAIGLCSPDEYKACRDQYSTLWIYDSVVGKFYRHENLTFGRSFCLEVARNNVPKNVVSKVEPATYEQVEEFMNFLPAGRPDISLLDQIVAFFRKVSSVHKTEVEAHVFIMWNPEKGYYVAVPRQKVSKASVTYEFDEETVPKGDVICIDIHSHNTMGAFFSGTDNNDDKTKINFSGVVGHLDKPTPAIVFRFNLLEEKRTVKVEDLFEAKREEAAVPDEWMGRIEKEVFPVYGGGYGYLGRRYSGGLGQFGGIASWSQEAFDDLNVQQANQAASLGKGNAAAKNASGGRNVDFMDMDDVYGMLYPGLAGKPEGAEIITFAEVAGLSTADIMGTEADLVIDQSTGVVTTAGGEFVRMLTDEEMESLDTEDVKGEILDSLTMLENNDQDLMEIIRRAHEMMSEQGHAMLATHGL